MLRGSTILLRAVVILIGLIVLAVCVFGLPRLILSELTGDFDYGPIFAGMYITAVPFFIALYQALKLLGYIERNKAFSVVSVSALRCIKYCAYTICALFAAGMPYIFYVAERDNAPGVAAAGFVVIGASFVIATFAAVMQKLVQNGVDLKLENDLTV
jgi:hypothetical protein